MIDMTHDRNDRWAFDHLRVVVLILDHAEAARLRAALLLATLTALDDRVVAARNLLGGVGVNGLCGLWEEREKKKTVRLRGRKSCAVRAVCLLLLLPPA